VARSQGNGRSDLHALRARAVTPIVACTAQMSRWGILASTAIGRNTEYSPAEMSAVRRRSNRLSAIQNTTRTISTSIAIWSSCR
jgi:hypothetical protein